MELLERVTTRLVKTFAIPRCYHPKDFGEAERKEIHAFSDASENAIGAAVYLKQVNHNGKVNVSLLFAQGQLSPKQATTIPRLELCAAVLTTQAVKWITRELKLNVDQILFYSDSKVVLGYIQNESRRFYIYVTNRVQIIRSISSPSQWTCTWLRTIILHVLQHEANPPSNLWRRHGLPVQNS